jgi:hypothetical protein
MSVAERPDAAGAGALAGVATDVLVQRDNRWFLQAHYVSMPGA